MAKHQLPACQKQAGFTLVELAIVMIIIGLLIAGVLKGQALITNAQITATVAQVKAIDAATTSFRDQYNAVPGDLAAGQAAARLPNCTAAPCTTAGNGDGRVDAGANDITFNAAATGEQLAYWANLNAAGLITGINPLVATAAWGNQTPAAKISGGGFDVGYSNGATVLNNGLFATTAETAGHYLALHGTPLAPVGATAPDTFLTANNAARLDTKLDDGVPATGSVLAAGAGACIAGAIYNEAISAASCNLYIKFQN